MHRFFIEAGKTAIKQGAKDAAIFVAVYKTLETIDNMSKKPEPKKEDVTEKVVIDDSASSFKKGP